MTWIVTTIEADFLVFKEDREKRGGRRRTESQLQIKYNGYLIKSPHCKIYNVHVLSFEIIR
jgi:hypothetical protein